MAVARDRDRLLLHPSTEFDHSHIRHRLTIHGDTRGMGRRHEFWPDVREDPEPLDAQGRQPTG